MIMPGASGVSEGFNTMFFKRFLSTIVLWLAVLTMVFSGWITGSWLFMALFGVLGQWEFYRAQEEKGIRVYKRTGLLAGFGLFLSSWWTLVATPHRPELTASLESAILICVVIGSLIRLVLFNYPKETPIDSIALSVLGFFYVPYLFNYVCKIAFWPTWSDQGFALLLYLFVVTKFSDIGAYLVGSWLGKHKMIPRVSPGKTWEGFTGGLLASLLASVFIPQLLGDKLRILSLTDSIILGLLLPLASVVGDLAESVIKRDAHIKDSGHTIPGIGGVLDLIDSILFTAPILYLYLSVFCGNPHA
jgi:phosphatidate cytidylyltransferase